MEFDIGGGGGGGGGYNFGGTDSFYNFGGGFDPGPEASPFNPGPHQSIFAPEPQFNWGQFAGDTANALGKFAKEAVKDRGQGPGFVAPGRVNYNPKPLPTPQSTPLPSPTAPGLNRFSNTTSFDQRMKAFAESQKGHEGPTRRSLQGYADGPSIAGKLRPDPRALAFNLGRKYG